MPAKCPICGHITADPSKTWKMKGNNQNNVVIEQYHCEKCGKPFRQGVPQ